MNFFKSSADGGSGGATRKPLEYQRTFSGDMNEIYGGGSGGNNSSGVGQNNREDSQHFTYSKSMILGTKKEELKWPKTLVSDVPIKTSEEYNKVVNRERYIIIAVLVQTIYLGPLMFRYVLGSRLPEDEDTNIPFKWASKIDTFEWYILIILFLGMVGTILRLMPAICGRPASVESSQKCVIEGIATFGTCSPFCSEDDAILLRNLIGRTAMVFHTVGSRHNIQGLYVDTVLNERRIKGEELRKNIWISWMKFLEKLVNLCKEIHTRGSDVPKFDENGTIRAKSQNSFINFREEGTKSKKLSYEALRMLSKSKSFMDMKAEKTEAKKEEEEAESKLLIDLHIQLDVIEPLISFMDGWLLEMKQTEWTFNFDDKNEVIDKLFLAAPFMHFFEGNDMLVVFQALDCLYNSFVNNISDAPDHKKPVHPDDLTEVQWVVSREGFEDWTVVWSIASRARLRSMPADPSRDGPGALPVYESTRIKPGAIVYEKIPHDEPFENALHTYLRSRKKSFKVLSIENTSSGKIVNLTRFPVDSSDDTIYTLPLSSVTLLEMNRGKTGALNFFNDYIRAKAAHWATELGIDHALQIFTGIVDARHAIVEPAIFWNDAIPYFSMLKDSSKASRTFGFGQLHRFPACITVQYPQFFSNILSDDYLDNSNSSYYNLWQTLRDCGKCITSSGTNAIWEISDPDFIFCTASRSEDLGTSHQYIPESASVYLCIYVANGIAKKTEDFLEALYRWSAGPLELLWPSFFEWRLLKHHLRVAIPVAILAMACFAENGWWYIIYLIMTVGFGCVAIIDKLAGRKPLRSFVVSTVIAINLFIVASNIMSITWMIIFPGRIAFFGKLPLGEGNKRSLFWGFVSIILALPTGIFHDALIRIARYTAPATSNLNYNRTLWRGGQLYACSFAFTMLATIAGSWSAIKALIWDKDLSMWSSFRVADSEYTKSWAKVSKASFISLEYFIALFNHLKLTINGFLASLTMPTVMTRRYVSFVFLYQFVCMGISTVWINADNFLIVLVLLFVCTLNIFLVEEVAMLLQPSFKHVFGYPLRMEYLCGYIGLLALILAIIQNDINLDVFSDFVRFPDFNSFFNLN